jgi:hypothetical protein
MSLSDPESKTALDCTRTQRLESDHREDWRKTHHTRLDETDLLCDHPTNPVTPRTNRNGAGARAPPTRQEPKILHSAGLTRESQRGACTSAGQKHNADRRGV